MGRVLSGSVSSAWHSILLPRRAPPLSPVFTRQARPEQRITRAIRGSVWIGCSPQFLPALPTAFLIGKLNPPPVPLKQKIGSP